jgi:hypothetical protein
MHRDYYSPGRTGFTSTSPCAASTGLPAAAARTQLRRVARRRLLVRVRRAARRRLLRLRRASGCLGTSRDLSSTTSLHAGSLSTTSPTPRVRLLRHVARLVAWLVVDYFASRRLVIDYFAYATRPGASARRAARHAARRRLLRLRRALGCLGTSRGSSRGTSRGSSSTTSTTPRIGVPQHVAQLVTRLVVDYFAYAVRPGSSASRAARHTARRAALRRLLRLAQARRRIFGLHRVSGCLGTSRGSSCGSSSTTSPRAGSYTVRPGNDGP